jgi:hypothetical protein
VDYSSNRCNNLMHQYVGQVLSAQQMQTQRTSRQPLGTYRSTVPSCTLSIAHGEAGVKSCPDDVEAARSNMQAATAEIL